MGTPNRQRGAAPAPRAPKADASQLEKSDHEMLKDAQAAIQSANSNFQFALGQISKKYGLQMGDDLTPEGAIIRKPRAKIPVNPAARKRSR